MQYKTSFDPLRMSSKAPPERIIVLPRMASQSSSRAFHGGEPEPEQRRVMSIHVSLDHRPQSDVVLGMPKDSELASKSK